MFCTRQLRKRIISWYRHSCLAKLIARLFNSLSHHSASTPTPQQHNTATSPAAPPSPTTTDAQHFLASSSPPPHLITPSESSELLVKPDKDEESRKTMGNLFTKRRGSNSTSSISKLVQVQPCTPSLPSPATTTTTTTTSTSSPPQDVVTPPGTLPIPMSNIKVSKSARQLIQAEAALALIKSQPTPAEKEGFVSLRSRKAEMAVSHAQNDVAREVFITEPSVATLQPTPPGYISPLMSVTCGSSTSALPSSPLALTATVTTTSTSTTTLTALQMPQPSSTAATTSASGQTTPPGRNRSNAFYGPPRPVFNEVGECTSVPSLRPSFKLASTDLPEPSSSLLLAPNTTAADNKKYTASQRFVLGLAHTIGRRPTMEDAVHLAGQFKGVADSDLFAVFDGHNGSDAANASAMHFHRFLADRLETIASVAGDHEEEQVTKAIEGAFTDTHRMIIDNNIKGGTTATVVFFRGDRGWVAHVGDSRVVLVNTQQAQQQQTGQLRRLTVDHRPSNPDEAQKVRDRGGFLISLGSKEMRVNGMLAVTRALGDRELCDALTSQPDVTRLSLASDLLTPSCLLVMACDGLWDFVSDDEVVSIIHSALTPSSVPPTPSTAVSAVASTLDPSSSSSSAAGISEATMERVAVELRNAAYKKGSMDNITVVVLKPLSTTPPPTSSSPPVTSI